MRCFAALARVMKLCDTKYRGGINEVTGLFLASGGGCQAVKNDLLNGLSEDARRLDVLKKLPALHKQMSVQKINWS